MKSQKTVILVTLIVVAVTLAIISAIAFASARTNVVTTLNVTSSGTNGYYPNGMMGGDWGGWMNGMMGGNWGPTSTPQTPTTTATQSSFLPLIGFATLIGAALTGTGGAIFYFAFPKAKADEPISPYHATTSAPVNLATPYSTISKTLTEEERKILDVLVLHNGKYLQKYIRAETGMSRLKIHRIVTRLAERGIVTFEKTGNTNEVHLSTWLQTSPLFDTTNRKDKSSSIEITT